ncbi:MAG TPA: adenylate/guanylate cyclase domain-containing protein [Solirubrobacterales bacterium]|nr:adenylate/guanylate cyclase domain-containing protein [Solirubrobacterales bacterium]
MKLAGSLRRRREVAILIVVLGAAAIAALAYATHLMRSLELQSVDARFSVRGTQERPEDIVVVGIDDVTFSDLGVQWPFPRSLHGRVIDRLHEAEAKAIAYDIQFTEETTPNQDFALFQAVRRAGGVVLSTTEVGPGGSTGVIGGEEVLKEAHARAANGNIRPDPGGIVRKMHYELEGLVTLPIATVEAATGESIDPSEMEGDGSAWIDFRGPPYTFRNIPFSRVLRGEVPDSAFRGKTVIVGATSSSLQDLHPTSTTGDSQMSGPELVANEVWTAENGFPLSSSGTFVDILLILLLAAIPAAITLRLSPPPALLIALALAAAYAGACQLAFESGSVLPVVYPLLALVLSALGALAVNYILNAFERQRVHDTFARFVPEAVVSEVLERTDDDLRLGGVRRDGTVLFSDLRGFTTFAETLRPDWVIDVLNKYLEEMSDAIMDHGGTLVAYMGDGIMAVFGAPIPQSDHADRALAAAREMVEVRLPRFNQWMVDEGMGETFGMGVGLNSGPVMSGQVGSKRRIEYTAIGDTTNTAARLEGMTKGSGHQLFVADSTVQALQRERDDLALVGELEVRGRTHKIVVWTLPQESPAEPSTSIAPASSGGDEQRRDEEGEDVKGLVDGDA